MVAHGGARLEQRHLLIIFADAPTSASAVVRQAAACRRPRRPRASAGIGGLYQPLRGGVVSAKTPSPAPSPKTLAKK